MMNTTDTIVQHWNAEEASNMTKKKKKENHFQIEMQNTSELKFTD